MVGAWATAFATGACASAGRVSSVAFSGATADAADAAGATGVAGGVMTPLGATLGRACGAVGAIAGGTRSLRGAGRGGRARGRVGFRAGQQCRGAARRLGACFGLVVGFRASRFLLGVLARGLFRRLGTRGFFCCRLPRGFLGGCLLRGFLSSRLARGLVRGSLARRFIGRRPRPGRFIGRRLIVRGLFGFLLGRDLGFDPEALSFGRRGAGGLLLGPGARLYFCRRALPLLLLGGASARRIVRGCALPCLFVGRDLRLASCLLSLGSSAFLLGLYPRSRFGLGGRGLTRRFLAGRGIRRFTQRLGHGSLVGVGFSFGRRHRSRGSFLLAAGGIRFGCGEGTRF